MAGYREFQTGEVLTAANVNDFLAKQAVMKFADATARDTALGTAVGGSNALREGMVAYLDSTDEVLAYDGTAWSSLGLPLGTATPTDGQILAFGTATSTWNPVDGGGFTAGTTITASDASWSVPSLASPIVKVTVVGGGGGGGKSYTRTDGSAGGSSTFACSAGTATAAGGAGGIGQVNTVTMGDASNGLVSSNGGTQGNSAYGFNDVDGGGLAGYGGVITIAYFDLTGVSTASVTVGAGGAGGAEGTTNGGESGGDGVVIVEYRAG